MNSVVASDTTIAVAALAKALGATSTNTDDVLDKTSSEAKASAIIRHRLSRAVVNSPHSVGLEEKDLERVTNDALAHTHAAFQLIGHTARVAEILESENIDFLVIKGVALGTLSQTPAGRGAGDVDILVAPRDIPRVHEIFRSKNFRTALALPDITKGGTWALWSFFDREATYLGQGTQIDLHWRISPQRKLFPTFAELYLRRTTVNVADRAIPTLSMSDSFAASCYHAYHDRFQPLRSVVDVVTLLQHVNSFEPSHYSPKLQRLISGVISFTGTLLPGIMGQKIEHLLTLLPEPPRIVKKRFESDFLFNNYTWEELQGEGPFDTVAEILPRFVAKRLFRPSPWSPSQQTTTLIRAMHNGILFQFGKKS
jgi:hypothetical protein